jgi:hypothetical protein
VVKSCVREDGLQNEENREEKVEAEKERRGFEN